MENFIGVSVADAAQQVRIGEGALEGVVITRQRFTELADRRGQHFEAARIVRPERRFAANQIERRAPLRSGFGQDDRSRLEIEGSEANFAGNLWARFVCAFSAFCSEPEATGDHQVNDHEQIAFQLPDHALAEAAQGHDFLSGGAIEWRVE